MNLRVFYLTRRGISDGYFRFFVSVFVSGLRFGFSFWRFVLVNICIGKVGFL